MVPKWDVDFSISHSGTIYGIEAASITEAEYLVLDMADSVRALFIDPDSTEISTYARGINSGD